MSAIEVPVGWDAMRGEPAFKIRFEQPPTHISLAEASMDRIKQIFGPLPWTVNLAVDKAMDESHAAAPHTYHEHRPAMKVCPFDPACRFV